MGDGSRGGCHIPKERYDGISLEELPLRDAEPSEPEEGDDPLEDEIRSDEERDFARKLRETREAHEAKLAAEKPTEATAAPTASFIRSPDRILGYRIHPVAATWPMLTESEITELGQSIKERGLHDAIILIDVDGEELILDGRNRGHACEIVGAEPHYETYTGPATSTR
jgi:hypothetical protein